MKHIIFRSIYTFILLFYLGNSNGQNPFFKVDTNYLSRHDIVYRTPAYEGFEGFPIGNGDIGGMVWNTNTGLEVQINKNDLFDQSFEENRSTLRGAARLNIDFGAPGFEWTYLDSFNARLSLQHALVSINAQTPFLNSQIETWVSSNKNVWCFQINAVALEKLKTGTKVRVSLERWGSRAFPGWYGYYSKNTKSGLGNTNSIIKGNDLVLEDEFEKLKFTVACRIIGEEANPEIISANRLEFVGKTKQSKHSFTLIVSLVTSNESENPTKAALQLLDNFENKSVQAEKKEHQKWWREFWNQSFVHLENDYIENIYYLRRYLMASSSRGKFPVVFNGGLWTWNHDIRNWVTPHHWNTQQQYWGLCSQNDCELMLPYLETYFRLMPKARAFSQKRGVENAILWSEPHDFFGNMTFWDRGDMINNFTPASQIAGLFWEYYQFTSDSNFLSNRAYPFMKEASAFYLKKLQWDSVKKEYFIFPSQPYENPRSNNLRNPITDRNVIISNFTNCIKAAKLLKKDTDLITHWEHIITHIWPIPYRAISDSIEVIEHAWYPNGTLFPKLLERGAWQGHMSASTSSVFPANLIGIDQKNTREFKALVNMINEHSPSINAISPDPIVAARLGMGNNVLKMMQDGIRRLQHFPQGLFYNIDHWYNLSVYLDSLKKPEISAQRDYLYDSRSHYPNKLPAKPFIQCGLEPLSIYGTAVNEMLLQSNADKIRVFPAVPDQWETCFKLLAKGSFLVSSERQKDGLIPGIYIESLQGNICKISNPWKGISIDSIYVFENGQRINFETDINNDFEFNTSKGKNYLIVSKSTIKKYTLKNYASRPNKMPKYFFEATLGKDRNY